MEIITHPKIEELELAVTDNQVEKVESLLKEDLQLVEQLINGSTKILLILANHSNLYIDFRSNYKSMLDLLAKYKINTFKVDGEILDISNDQLLQEIIKCIDTCKLKYRTLLEHVGFFILDNNISYKKEDTKYKHPRLIHNCC